MKDTSRHESTLYSIIRGSIGRKHETLCGPMLSIMLSLFTLQDSLCHRKMQPTSHEEEVERMKLRYSKLAVKAEQQSWKARTDTAKAGCHL